MTWYTIEATETAPGEMARIDDRSEVILQGPIRHLGSCDDLAKIAQEKTGLPFLRVYKGKSIGRLIIHR